MSLLFNMVSRLVIAFLPRNKCLNSTAAVTICSDFGAQQNKVSHCFRCISTYCHEVMGPDTMILAFWTLSFKPTFSLSSVTFIKRLFSSPLSAIRVVSPAHLRLLIFLPAILIPACALSSLTFYNYCKTVIGMNSGWEVTVIVLRICSPFTYNWKTSFCWHCLLQ